MELSPGGRAFDLGVGRRWVLGGGLVEPGLDGFDGPGLDGLVPVVVDLPEESGIRMYLEGEGGAGQSVVPGLPVGLRGR